MRTTPHWWASEFVEDLKRQFARQGVTLPASAESDLYADTLRLIQDVQRDTTDDVKREHQWR